MDIRVGFGYDVHQLTNGDGFVLGGVKIPHTKSLIAHSDGDVLIHALCDALLGAANLRDIGFHFPDTSNVFKGIASTVLLEKTIDILADKGFSVINADSTVCLQKPKIKELIPEMQKVLSRCMKIPEENISIKATTTEKLGFEGREEGVSVHSVCLIQRV
jgi:2-C-methyl-D-erythritol 2,4-cyclodiphosphate synthase